MSIENIFILTVLINVGIYDFTDGGIIRAPIIQKLNITGIVGEWNLLASEMGEDYNSCKNIFVEQQSENSFTMHLKMYDRPTSTENGTIPMSLMLETILYITKEQNSEIFIARNDDRPERYQLVVLDVVYDSYMALYVGNELQHPGMNSNEYVVIFGRDETLPHGVLEKVQQLYIKQVKNPDEQLRAVDFSVCVQ